MVEEKKKQIETMLTEMDKLQDELSRSKKSLAEVTISHQNELLASSAEFRAAIE